MSGLPKRFPDRVEIRRLARRASVEAGAEADQIGAWPAG